MTGRMEAHGPDSGTIQAEKSVYQVTLEIRANASNYWARMEFKDRAGHLHEKVVSGECKATLNSNLIRAVTEAVKALRCPCLLEIRTDDNYLIGPLRNGWVRGWEKNNWKNAKGKEVANREQWQLLIKRLAPHSIKLTKIEEKSCLGAEKKH